MQYTSDEYYPRRNKTRADRGAEAIRENIEEICETVFEHVVSS